MNEKTKRERINFYITYLLAKRDYSENEIRWKVSLKEYYDESILNEFIKKYKEIGYINDQRCAAILVKSRYMECYGVNKIKEKAYQRKIDPNLIDNELSKYDFFTTCLEYANKKFNSKKYELSDVKELNKFKRKLLSRGFTYEQVDYAIKELKD